MTFDQILPALRDGKHAKRALWDHLSGEIAQHVELRHMGPVGRVLICPLPSGQAVLFACSQWDILADDWVILG